MKKYIKKIVNKAIPSLAEDHNKIKEIYEITSQTKKIIDNHDFRLDRLKIISKGVEPYQPLYSLGGVLDNGSKRDTVDRCRAIEGELKNKIAGLNILDIGSSLGYLCFYFADRGARIEGWDYNPKNIEVSSLVSQINGIRVDFKSKELDLDTVATIEQNKFDIVTILSVLHHIIYYKGLEYTKNLMEELLERVPMLIVELAQKGEDKSLYWDKTLPDNALDVFQNVLDSVDIKKIGDFHNHLSGKTRPMYILRKKNIINVNDKPYMFDFKTNEAYDGSPVVYSNLQRRYYFNKNIIIKEYLFDDIGREENSTQILTELTNLLKLKNLKSTPRLIDYEINNNSAKVIIKRNKGKLVSELLDTKIDILKLTKDILATLSELEEQGYCHNDLRSWNVIYDGERARLIDYGFVSYKSTDNDAISLLWLINAILTKTRESYSVDKQELPPKLNFKSSLYLNKLYKKVEKGEYSPKELLSIL